MGTPQEPKPTKYFVAMLLSDAELLTAVENALTELLGAVDDRSEIVFVELDNARGIFRHLDGCQRSVFVADLRREFYAALVRPRGPL